VVDTTATGEDWLVVEPVDVWMVHLGAGSKPSEVRGTLTLGASGLEFVERKTGTDVRFDYDSIRRVKRIKGSPVLVVDRRVEGEDRKTAFYFAQPPPLDPVPGSSTIDPRGPLGQFRRVAPSKRQVARTNLRYLRSTSLATKHVVRAWAEALAERVGRTG
jgi:hypothetical protein